MKILTCTSYYYYGHSQGVEPQFYYLCKVPEAMGHQVDFFDYPTAARIGLEQMRRSFLRLVKSGYDAVFLATSEDQFDRETLAEAARHAPILAWNSDDEWRWNDYSGPRADWYTFMVTNSPEIWERHRGAHPNLLHAQWACTGFWEGLDTRKDIDFSFVGAAYGPRGPQIDKLRRTAGLKAYGKGTRCYSGSLVPTKSLRMKLFNRLVNWGLRHIKNVDDLTVIPFELVNALWNRSKISFTPLDSSSGGVRQIKSRIFDMGLSGTLMLAHRAPSLDRYYEPDKEYVPFETLDECADKARFYLKNETARRRIAEEYARRTRAEHLWQHRIASVLKQAGLE